MRVKTHPQGTRSEQGQDDELPLVDIKHFRNVVISHISENNALVHPQVIGSAHDHGGGSSEGNPEVELDGAENDHELTDKAGGGRQAGVGHGEEHEEGGELGHGIDHAAVIGDLTAMNPVVHDPDTEEHGAGDKSVGNHLHQSPLDAHGAEHEEAQRHETHVGDGRISHQFLHVGLDQGYEADVDDGYQRQGYHESRQLVRGVRRDRQREAQEAVGAQLQHDRGQHHRAAGGRLDVGVRQPGVDRPHRHLDGKGNEESKENPDLGIQCQRQLVPLENGETTAGLHKEIHQGKQEQQGARQGIKEELEGCVNPVRTAPHTDDQV